MGGFESGNYKQSTTPPFGHPSLKKGGDKINLNPSD